MATIPFGSHVVRYSMDGITCLDKSGSIIWTHAYEIRDPIAAACGSYMAIAARNGNQAYIFNESGYQGTVMADYPILDLDIAEQGVISVIMESDDMNYVKLYDTAGKELTTIKTSLEGNGYPLDIGLSQDGRKLAISYLDVGDDSLETSLVFYNYSDVGQNYTEQLVGAYTEEELGDIFAPEVLFANRDTVCAFSDQKIIIFEMQEKPSLEATIELEGEVRSIFYDDKHIGLIYPQTIDGALYRLCVYDLAGNLLFEKNLYQNYNQIYFDGSQIIIHDDHNLTILTVGHGKEKFNYTFDNTIVLFKHIADNRYIWMTSSSISEIRLE
jgi:hypothetical protein